MTIKSDWMHIWKASTAPSSFSAACQHAMDVVFIDGQIKLMKSSHITTWGELCRFMFVNPVNKYFASGAKTVVLAFDNYTYVPVSKNMTQLQRLKHVPDIECHKNDTLPSVIPFNWQERLMNRTFKTKVIKMLAETIPQLVNLGPGQQLIIDYYDHPVSYAKGREPLLFEDLRPLGEADIKFCRYSKLGNMVVDATDGDYIPIGLLHIEKSVALGQPVPNISLYRMEINLKGPKRDKNGTLKHSYEYVHLNNLYVSLRQGILQKLGGTAARLGNADGAQMRLLAALITYTSCDFSKGLPYISAKRIWDNLHLIWKDMAEAFNAADMQFDAALVTNKVVAKLYSIAYPKHVRRLMPGPGAMAGVAESLKRKSQLSGTVRDRLPEEANVLCAVKNGNWVLLYWTLSDEFPGPLDGDFGYKRNKRGVCIWEDCDE